MALVEHFIMKYKIVPIYGLIEKNMGDTLCVAHTEKLWITRSPKPRTI